MLKMLSIKGFAAFLGVIFINAFVDLGHKIIIQNTVLKVYDGQQQIILTAIVNALILIPFVLLFTPSGYLSDHFKKPKVMKISAFIAILITLGITASYYLGWFQAAFALTFILAIQSAFYSPSKYGYIAEISSKEDLSVANAIVQMITIVAILSGIFLFSMLFETLLINTKNLSPTEILTHIAPLGWVLVILSIVEWRLTQKLPIFTVTTEKKPFSVKKYISGKYLKQNLRTIFNHQVIWLSIIGLAIFWSISQVVIATFPAYVKAVLNTDNTMLIQGILASTGIGIVLGSILAGKLSKHHIETALIPLGALGLVTNVLFLPHLTQVSSMVICCILFGISGGLFIVPLNTLIQFHAKDEQRGMILAGNNWLQNIAMLFFLGLTVLFAYLDFQATTILYFIGLVTFIGAIYTVYQLPQSLVRYISAILFSSRYHIQVKDFKYIPAQGGVLFLGNHISWLDWAILQIASPRPIRFVMHRTIYKKWYLKHIFDFFKVIPIAGGHSRKALLDIGERLKNGEVVCLFPEGGISRSGQLAEFKKGYELAVKDLNEGDAVILPFYVHGLWGSFFSRSSERLQENRGGGIRRDVVVAFGKPLSIKTKVTELKSKVFDLSVGAWQVYSTKLENIPSTWITQVKKSPKKLAMIQAQGDIQLSAASALTGAINFSKLIQQQSPEKNIGLLVPTSIGGLIANMAAFLADKTVINLNYTATIDSLKSAIEQADIKTLYTSKQFIKKLNAKGIDLSPLFEQKKLIYLEDLKTQVSTSQKIRVFLAVYALPTFILKWLYCPRSDIHTVAAILFSSGSEGEPKGIVLTHQHLISNLKQVSDVLNAKNDDVIMATLPLFHAFGLTVTSLMPLLEGIPVVVHPDPTDTLNIAKAIHRYQARIYFSTSTFLRLLIHNKRVQPLMLKPLRLIIAGAERLNPEIREQFKQKFNQDIYEGYGTTETAPVASVNIENQLDPSDWRVQIGHKAGTVGLPVPGTSFRIVDPNSMETLPLGEDGLILIGGIQIMQGYLNNAEKTAEVITILDDIRWYKTGDKGHLDQDGFLTIIDRYSRFAKIAGEMISLSAVEQALISTIEAGDEILAVAIPDPKKGEKIVLLYAGKLPIIEIEKNIKNIEINNLMKPHEIIKVTNIPKLGSGKTDFKAANKLLLTE